MGFDRLLNFIIKNFNYNYNFIIDDIIYVDFGLVKCVLCGNIWDGNAQCQCNINNY